MRARLGKRLVAAALVGVSERGLLPVRAPDLTAARARRHAQRHIVAKAASRPGAAAGCGGGYRVAAAAAAEGRARILRQTACAALRLPAADWVSFTSQSPS